MKKITLSLLIILCVFIISACGCEHDWKDATCTEPQHCFLCDETFGEPLGHKWKAATCQTPEICDVCNEENGFPLEHTWLDATCTDPQICSICDEVGDSALGHTKGAPVTISKATTTQAGIEQTACAVCSAVLDERFIFYYDITPEEEKQYANILNTVHSIAQIHLNPESFELLGAVTTDTRTTICLAYEGMDGKVYTDYFWKDFGENEISNRFGSDNYKGTFSPVKELDIAEIMYYENCGAYVEKLVSSKYINVSY